MFKLIKESDESLVKGILSGRRDDFGVLVRRHLPAVRAIAYARLGNAADVDDAVQECFLRAFERLDTLREPAKFGPWVLAIARDRAYKILRKNVREQRAAIELGSEELVMGPDVEKRDIWELVYNQILQMDENQREVILLRYVSGKSIREIASLLDTTPNAAKKRLQRAREALSRKALRELRETSLTKDASEKRALRIMGIVAGMSVAWEAKAGTVAGSAMAGGGLLSGKLLAWLAGVCVLSVLVAVPLRHLRSEPASAPASEMVRLLPDRPSGPAPDTPAHVVVSNATNGVTVSANASGQVVDEQTGEGIDRALVTIQNKDGGTAGDGKTDGAGQFRIAGLPNGTFRVIVSGDYIVPQAEPVEFDIVNGADTQGIAVPVLVGGVVEGHVNDAESGSGVPEVRMAASAESTALAEDRHARTDATGRYRITGVPAGRSRVVCGSAAGYPEPRPGYSREYQNVLVKAGQTISNVNFSLRAGITVRGLVVDHDGTPIAGAEVLARGTDTGGARATESDDDGSFVLRGLNATPELYVVARKPGYAEAPAGPFILKAAGIEDLIIQVEQESTLKGQVIDQVGRPVPEATVTAYPAKDFPFREPEGETGPSGEFTIQGLWAGQFDVRLAPPSATQPEGSARQVTVPAAGTLDGLILTCETGDLAIAGTVTNQQGQPLRAIWVSAVGSSDSHTITRRAATDGQGHYVIAGLSVGTYEVHVFDPHYMEARKWAVAAGSKDVEFELGPRATIGGQVVRADTGEPITRFEVLVHPGLAMKVSPWMENEFIQIQDEDGRFSLSDTPGSMGFAMVAARAPGYAPAIREIPGIAPGRAIEDVVLRLEPGIQLDGIVVNGEGQPVQGALIFTGGMPENSTPETGASTRTDADGLFYLNGIDPGLQQVTAYHADYAPGSVSVPAEPSERSSLRIRLPRAGALEGTATLNGTPLSGEWIRLDYVLEGPIASDQVSTDSNGRFQFLNLPPGDVTVSASPEIELDGHEVNYKLSRQARILPERKAVLDLALQTGNASIEGTVRIQDVPVSGGEVGITVHTASGESSRTVSIRADGTYSASGLPGGTANLTVKTALSEDGPKRTKVLSTALVDDETIIQDVAFTSGGALAIRVEGEDAAVGIVAGEVQLPTEPGLQAFAEIEASLVWESDCKAGETVQVSGLEPGRYTAIAIVDPLGERRTDADAVTVDENAAQQVRLEPR